MILPLGIFVAMIWSLTFLIMNEDDPAVLALVGAFVIIAATIAIHFSWPVAALAEAVK